MSEWLKNIEKFGDIIKGILLEIRYEDGKSDFFTFGIQEDIRKITDLLRDIIEKEVRE